MSQAIASDCACAGPVPTGVPAYGVMIFRKEVSPMNLKRISFTALLCLLLCVSLLPVSAFADQTVIIVGGSVQQDSAVVVQGAPAQNATVLAGGAGTIVSDGASGRAAAGTQNSLDTGAVIVMPDGSVIAPQTAQNNQTTAVSNNATGTVTRAASAVPAGLAGQIYQRINDYRSANGLGVLGYDAKLQGTADLRAKESATSFGHTRPDGSAAVTAVTVDYTVAGENLIQVTKELATVDIIVETWLASPTHKANIVLADFSQTAIGVYESNGTLFISQIFTD